MTAEIEGHVDSGFEGVRDAFVANFANNAEVGAAFSLYVEGKKVVDIWGGVADVKTGRPYTEDDPTHPLGAYAVSKLAGELYAQAYLDGPLIIRTSGVFGPGSPIYDDSDAQADVIGTPLYETLKTMWLELGVQQGMVAGMDGPSPSDLL